MDRYGIKTPSFEEVRYCANSFEGTKLFAQFGKETDSLQPPHTFVPWIIFNGVRSL